MIEEISKQYLKKNVPQLAPGDTVRVHQQVREGNKTRVQIFEGLVIKVQHGQGIDGSFTVRKISNGVGVERTFALHSPLIVKIDRVKTSNVRRAKLYYMRERFGKRARMSGEKRVSESWEETRDEELIDKAKEQGIEVSEEDLAEEASVESTEEIAPEVLETANPDENSTDAGTTAPESEEK